MKKTIMAKVSDELFLKIQTLAAQHNRSFQSQIAFMLYTGLGMEIPKGSIKHVQAKDKSPQPMIKILKSGLIKYTPPPIPDDPRSPEAIAKDTYSQRRIVQLAQTEPSKVGMTPTQAQEFLSSLFSSAPASSSEGGSK